MTFKEFLKLDELEGQFGAVKAHAGPLDLIHKQVKMCKPVKGHGSTISRIMQSFASASPARPPKITSIKGPLTQPSVLK
jgi:hypothetical protein